MREFTFNVCTNVKVQVRALTEEAARQMLTEAFTTYSANFGAWPDGDPILGVGGGFCDEPKLAEEPLDQVPHFYVYEDYGYVTERELFASPSLTDAKTAFLSDRHRPSPGAICTELAYFASDGEYIVMERENHGEA